MSQTQNATTAPEISTPGALILPRLRDCANALHALGLSSWAILIEGIADDYTVESAAHDALLADLELLAAHAPGAMVEARTEGARLLGRVIA
ncbi:hypothetical protein IU433_12400 [Nocardia puris]|uniref:hypothetical protein n=1 Tax=Nocardia puris TaxID=208602 RepID=UPI0018957B75|nr:hypothetical protein [Nocardia puris]MBF6459838.1 hypothetical protein [Nocardia puris]